MFEELRGIIIEEPRNYYNLGAEYPKTDIQTLYNDGWWITEIFGSYAVLVRISRCITRKTKKPYFVCLYSRLDIKQLKPQALKTIENINQQQWNKYKHLLLGTQYETRNSQPKSILLETQRRTVEKIRRKSKGSRIQKTQITNLNEIIP